MNARRNVSQIPKRSHVPQNEFTINYATKPECKLGSIHILFLPVYHVDMGILANVPNGNRGTDLRLSVIEGQQSDVRHTGNVWPRSVFNECINMGQ